jgi:DNA-binding response OmpR family regulator
MVKPAILLLEEYEALAAAISSALKKFAPTHATHVARSLKEAESLAAAVRPELLIIDVDPRWPKLTQLLGKMRDEYPEARVLVIGGTIPPELIEHGGSRRALQFLEKPFDVPELGAAVQALLGPWKSSEIKDLRGTLRAFGVIDAALLQCASASTITVEVKKSGGKSGELHFVDGQLFHVERGKRSGVSALEELFSWPQPEMREKEKRARPSLKRTIATPWAEPFLEALENTKTEEPEKVSAVSPAETVTPPPPARTGKKIVVIDDTEMLLIFVEDVLATTDPQLQITTASDALSGVEAVERVVPDLVLLDYSLPDFNGDEVCRRLIENERTAGIPVLMMSGHIPEMMRVAATWENVVATIEKPFLSEALVTVVQQTLEAAPKLRKRKAAATKKAHPPQREPAPQPVTHKVQPAKHPAKGKPAVRAEPPRSQRTIPAVAPEPPPPRAPATAEPPPAPRIVPPPTQPKPQIATPPKSPPPAMAPPPPPAAPAPPPKPTPPPRRIPATPLRPPPPVPVPFEQPVPHVISVAPPPVQQIPRPGLISTLPARVETEAPVRSGAIGAPVLKTGVHEVVLGLFLEVVSLQLTPALRMGTIRAKPSSLTVSLHAAAPALRAALPPNGFQLGAIDLDRSGRIATIRLTPTVQPFTPLRTRNALQIGGVSVVPENSHELLQLTPSAEASMRMHLLAPMEVAGVELASNFQIAQLVLKSRTNKVRVTLNEQAIEPEQSGTTCETSAVQLDGAARLKELTLNPIG